jgi:hypothetical protein
MSLSGGDPFIFFERPVSGTLIGLAILGVGSFAWMSRGKKPAPAAHAPAPESAA